MATNENLIKVFEYALGQEYTGKSFFEASLVRLQIGAAVSAFKTLIEQEEKHIRFISRLLNDLRTGRQVEEEALKSFAIEPTDFFDERAKSEFLERTVNDSMIPDVTVFNTAWLIEKDLSEFYASAARQTEGKASDALGMLSGWEKGHERFFKEYRDKLTEQYANMPWGG